LRPEGFEVGLGLDHLFVEGILGGHQLAAKFGFFIAHLSVRAHLGELHVQLEDLFEKFGRDDLLLLLAGGAGGVGGGLRLLLKLNAFEREQVLGAGDGVFQGAVGVVEERGLGEGGLLLGEGLAGEAVGVQLAGEEKNSK
jgi:hypothetical protein